MFVKCISKINMLWELQTFSFIEKLMKQKKILEILIALIVDCSSKMRARTLMAQFRRILLRQWIFTSR